MLAENSQAFLIQTNAQNYEQMKTLPSDTVLKECKVVFHKAGQEKLNRQPC